MAGYRWWYNRKLYHSGNKLIIIKVNARGRPCKEAKLDYAKRGNQAEEKVERGGQIIGEDRGQSIIEGALVSIGMVLFRSFG